MKRSPRLAAVAALATIAVATIPATASATTKQECQDLRYATALRFLRYAEESMDAGDFSGAMTYTRSANYSLALVSRCV